MIDISTAQSVSVLDLRPHWQTIYILTSLRSSILLFDIRKLFILLPPLKCQNGFEGYSIQCMQLVQ